MVQLVKDHERGDIPKIDWLDRLAFRQIAALHAVSILRTVPACSRTDDPGRNG
jgi:hypothetical protein